MNVYIVQHIATGKIVAVFSNAKNGCAYADFIDHGDPDPDFIVLKSEVLAHSLVPGELE